MKFAAGLLIAFALGAMCRWLDLPVPSPPRVGGVLLILAITLGYLTVDHFASGSSSHAAEKSKPMDP